MVGKIFGRLTVIKYSHSGKGGRYWECLCSCGNTIYVTTKKLNSKNTRSCGCLHSEIIRMNNVKLKSKINQEEIIGKKFDFLEVIERIDVFKKGPTKYRCYCHNCKNYKVIKYSDLVGDRVHACGCLSSWGEAKLKTLLLNNNINFKTQFSFDDLKSKKNYPLRFDFAIYDKINRMKCLIEYQETNIKIRKTHIGQRNFLKEMQ